MKAHLRATSVSSLLPRKTFCISQPPAFQALMIKLTRSRQMMRTDPAFFSVVRWFRDRRGGRP